MLRIAAVVVVAVLLLGCQPQVPFRTSPVPASGQPKSSQWGSPPNVPVVQML